LASSSQPQGGETAAPLQLPPVKESVRNLRSEKAREIMDKVRAARGLAHS
jgi:hypothetical protein